MAKKSSAVLRLYYHILIGKSTSSNQAHEIEILIIRTFLSATSWATVLKQQLRRRGHMWYNLTVDRRVKIRTWGGVILLPVKKRIDSIGRVSIGEVLEVAKIKPGDWVEVVPGNNKVTIKVSKRTKTKGAVRAAAGILKDRPDLVDEMLRIREDEDDRPGTEL
ncbi:MAG: hypothetical protein ACYC2T_15090 [Bacillota bacterium]